jgi:predicted porin
MKKTLVALAAVSAVSASFAQSSMSFTGLFDRGYTVISNSGNTAAIKGLSSASGTTRFEVNGTEDLGGGMKAKFFIETDWNPLAGAAGSPSAGQFAGYNSGAAPATTISALGGFANSESWLAFETNNGTLKVGTPNNEIFIAVNTVGQAGFSTGIGSIYSSNFSIFNGIGTGNATGSGGVATYVANSTSTANAVNAGARPIRQDNTLKYESPTYNGFKFAYEMAQKNDYNNTSATGAVTSRGNVGATGYSLKYSNGPLNAVYAAISYDVGNTAATQVDPELTVTTKLANQTQNNTYIAANYLVMPTLKVSLGQGTSKSSDGTTVNATTTNWSATYTMGQTDLMYNFAKKNDMTAIDQDQKITALGANYNFSKMTYGYYRYDKIDYSMNKTFAGSQQTRNAIGFAVKF